MPGVRPEARLDSAFFSDPIVSELAKLGVELKGLIEARKRWQRLDADLCAFELRRVDFSW